MGGPTTLNRTFFLKKVSVFHTPTNKEVVIHPYPDWESRAREELGYLFAFICRVWLGLGLAGWLGWPAPSYGHCFSEPVSSTSFSHKRISNDTNQPTEQAAWCWG